MGVSLKTKYFSLSNCHFSLIFLKGGVPIVRAQLEPCNVILISALINSLQILHTFLMSADLFKNEPWIEISNNLTF